LRSGNGVGYGCCCAGEARARGLSGVVCAVDCVAAALCAVGLLVEGGDGAGRLGALRCGSLRAGAGVGGRIVLAVVGVVETGSDRGRGAVALVLLAVCGKEDHANLLLLDGGLVGGFNAGPDLRDREALCGVGGDGDGLDEELVFAADVKGRVLLHGLEENLDFDMAGGLDAAGVWAHAVPGGRLLEVAGRVEFVEVDVLFRRGGLDLESDSGTGRVGQAQDLGDFVGERAYSQWYVSHVVASWLLGQLDGGCR
jgi:hypothetical protein